jgi:carboxyl-terminal processing protease
MSFSPPPTSTRGTNVPPGPPPESAGDRHSRTPIWVALFIVAVLSGSALFASGFTLGLQQSLSPGTPTADRELFEPFWEAWHKISTEYVGETEPKTLVEGAISGMFDALDDPYSSYMSSREYQESLAGISGEIEGIGADMGTRGGDGQPCEPIGDACRLVVSDVLADSPAQRGGLVRDDELVAVDGEPIDGSTVAQVVDRVRGPKGTTVTLSIVRDGNPLDLAFTRDIVRLREIRSEVLANGTVGYLDIEGFSSNASDEFRARLKEQLDLGLRRFVIDIRDEPGGFVDAAVSMASQFVGSGPIYWEETADGSQFATDADPGGLATDPGIRVAVLVNGGTASASEILAGALQDTGRAELVGDTTFGKGTIQQWHLLGDGQSGGFRLSVAKWLTPNKTWVHGTGLPPDVPVSAGSTGDPQLERALAVLATGSTAAPRPSPLAAVSHFR